MVVVVEAEVGTVAWSDVVGGSVFVARSDVAGGSMFVARSGGLLCAAWGFEGVVVVVAQTVAEAVIFFQQVVFSKRSGFPVLACVFFFFVKSFLEVGDVVVQFRDAAAGCLCRVLGRGFDRVV